MVESHGQDKYKRTLGDIFLSNGTHVNRELVAEDWCWWYRKYAPDVILIALRRREWPEKDCGLTQAQCYRGSGEKALNSFDLRLHEGLLGRNLGYPLTYTDRGGVLCAPFLVVS